MGLVGVEFLRAVWIWKFVPVLGGHVCVCVSLVKYWSCAGVGGCAHWMTSPRAALYALTLATSTLSREGRR